MALAEKDMPRRPDAVAMGVRYGSMGYVLIMVMIVTGLVRQFFGTPIVAESAQYAITPDAAHTNLTGLALLFFALRAFASGTTALTGIEAEVAASPDDGIAS